MSDLPPPAEPGPAPYASDEEWVEPHRLGRRGRLLSWFLGIGALLLLALLAFYLAHNSSSAGADGGGGRRHGGGAGGGRGGGMNMPTTVGTATAAGADLPVIVEALGTVTPAATVTVRPQVGGTITQLLYREGQMVHKGETLAIIDPRPYRAALLQAQGNMLRDEALLDNARVQLKRYQILIAQDSIARQDVDTQAALVKQYQGTVEADRGTVQQAQINVGYTRVIAPVSGRIGLKVVDIGNYIGAGDTNGIAVVTTLQPIDIEFAIPQDQAPAIAKRVMAGATIPAIALDRTRTQTLDTGRFSTLDNQVDTTTGTIKGKARFGNAGGQLYPSQFVNVRLTVNMVANAVTIPPSAVRSGQDGSFVWLFNQDRTVSQRKVTTGVTTADQVQIVTGLALGEIVITDGGDRLTDGAKVRLPTDKPPAGMASGGGGRGGKHHRHKSSSDGGDNSQQAAPAAAPTPAPVANQPAVVPARAAPATSQPRAAAPLATTPASAPATASASALPPGGCPKPPAGLAPEDRHAWFQQHMAGLTDDQRDACRAQRRAMRQQQGGGDGGQGG